MRGYLTEVTAAAILAALIRRLAPKEGAGRGARLGAGLLILLAVFGPLARLDTLAAAESLVRRGYGDPLTTQDFSLATNELLAGLISQEAEAYILDKAEEWGVSIQAEVETCVTEAYPVPWRAVIRGSLTARQRSRLSQYMTQELGIPEERQEWWSM